MKFLKYTLLAILTIGLLTAVLPSTETEPSKEVSNHDVTKPIIKLAMIDKTKIKRPDQG